jgi:putative transposase
MPRKSQFTDEQIIRALREVDAGAKPADVCRRLGVTDKTFYRWRSKFGGLDVSEARRLRVLEEENARLKKLLAEHVLDNAALRAVLEKKMVTPTARRRVVGYLQQAFGMSERRACRATGQCRATQRYEAKREEPARLRAVLLQLAKEKPRYGYRFLHRMLRRKGFRVAGFHPSRSPKPEHDDHRVRSWRSVGAKRRCPVLIWST